MCVMGWKGHMVWSLTMMKVRLRDSEPRTSWANSWSSYKTELMIDGQIFDLCRSLGHMLNPGP